MTLEVRYLIFHHKKFFFVAATSRGSTSRQSRGSRWLGNCFTIYKNEEMVGIFLVSTGLEKERHKLAEFHNYSILLKNEEGASESIDDVMGKFSMESSTASRINHD